MPNEKKEKDPQYEEFHLENSVYYTEVPDSFKNRSVYKPLDIKQITASIPGTIVEIYIKPGQKMEIDDQLLILEAMKMRNRVNSPINGEIKSIKVKIGDIVRKNELLIEFK